MVPMAPGRLAAGLVLAGSGVILAYYGIKRFRASGRRHTYEPVEAKVLDSRLDESRTGGSTSYRPAIEYEYTVEGESYVNRNVYPGPGGSRSSAKDKHQDIVNKYPEGETVEAHYDPNDPSVSFLEDESRKRQAVKLGLVGGLCILFGLVLIVGMPL